MVSENDTSCCDSNEMEPPVTPRGFQSRADRQNFRARPAGLPTNTGATKCATDGSLLNRQHF
jgi:hypothetical protein